MAPPGADATVHLKIDHACMRLARALLGSFASQIEIICAEVIQTFVWQVADAQMWLKQACKMVTEGPLTERTLDYAVALEQAFPPGDDNAYSHIRISDFSDTVAALPPEELQVSPSHCLGLHSLETL